MYIFDNYLLMIPGVKTEICSAFKIAKIDPQIELLPKKDHINDKLWDVKVVLK